MSIRCPDCGAVVDYEPGSPMIGLDALIFAGGLGIRSRAYLGSTPKVLAPVKRGPLLDYLVDHLASSGVVNRAVLSLGQGREAVLTYLADYAWPIEMHTSWDLHCAGTVLAMRQALSARYRAGVMRLLRTDPLLVLNGDTLLSVDLAAALTYYRSSGCEALELSAPDGTCSGVRLLSPAAVAEVIRSSAALVEDVPLNYHTLLVPRSSFVDVGTREGWEEAQRWAIT